MFGGRFHGLGGNDNMAPRIFDVIQNLECEENPLLVNRSDVLKLKAEWCLSMGSAAVHRLGATPDNVDYFEPSQVDEHEQVFEDFSADSSLPDVPYGMPHLELLDEPTLDNRNLLTNTAANEMATLVETKLKDFGVQAQVVAVHPAFPG